RLGRFVGRIHADHVEPGVLAQVYNRGPVSDFVHETGRHGKGLVLQRAHDVASRDLQILSLELLDLEYFRALPPDEHGSVVAEPGHVHAERDRVAVVVSGIELAFLRFLDPFGRDELSARMSRKKSKDTNADVIAVLAEVID